MGTLSLTCPLCCQESFESCNALKEHIHSLMENLSCPACNNYFDDVKDLIDHLGRDCVSALQEEEMQEVVEEQEKELEEEHFEVQPKVETEANDVDEEASYHCQMCNMQFESVEEHLNEYHVGEEVILETEEEREDAEGEELDEAGPEEDQEEESPKTITEEECMDERGVQYTRKVVQIGQFWNKTELEEDEEEELEDMAEPVMEKFFINEGKLKKVTFDEAEQMEDKECLIEIHQCPRCCLQFSNLSHFIKHKCDDASKTKHKYRCAYCTVLFLNLKSLQAHMKSHSNDDLSVPPTTITLGPYKCDICHTMLPSFKSLRLHSRMHDPVPAKQIEAPVNYTICGAEAREEENEIEMFDCSICNKSYNIEYKEVHLNSHLDEENHICGICNRKFPKENIEMHMRAHSNGKKFTCSYCKKAFLTHEALAEHVSKQCQKRQYECQYCGRRFSRPHEKVKHERIHTGEKPHICEICGKAFRVSYCLTLHMRTHSGTRPYLCAHCSKRFKSHSAYTHHLLTHSDVRAFKCPYCTKAFKTMVQLAGHKNSHVKPFSCKECNRPFASLYAVRAHMDTHKRENNLKYECWLCGATYARSFALKDHMKAHHEETVLTTLEGEGVVTESEVAVSVDKIEELSQEMTVEEVCITTQHLQ